MDRKKYFSMVCRNPYWARERTGSVRGVTKTRVLCYPGVSTCTGINTDTACVRKVMRRAVSPLLLHLISVSGLLCNPQSLGGDNGHGRLRTFPCHDQPLTRYRRGCKTRRMEKQEGKVSVADRQRPRSKVTLRALLLAAINLPP